MSKCTDCKWGEVTLVPELIKCTYPRPKACACNKMLVSIDCDADCPCNNDTRMVKTEYVPPYLTWTAEERERIRRQFLELAVNEMMEYKK